ncbi:hypothetical protein PUN28_005519 [Cardiocondyla obscurior]|uniref:Uncharacterized protein n=1 Tax=Cardiocondyla obscurior TaxID=286306 RepID=A0AAW2GI97_9HYME
MTLLSLPLVPGIFLRLLLPARPPRSPSDSPPACPLPPPPLPPSPPLFPPDSFHLRQAVALCQRGRISLLSLCVFYVTRITPGEPPCATPRLLKPPNLCCAHVPAREREESAFAVAPVVAQRCSTKPRPTADANESKVESVRRRKASGETLSRR